MDPEVIQRYERKISVIGIDPYTINKDHFSDIKQSKSWPDISYIDIVNFLIFQESAYSQEQLKNYKSLEAYKLFQDGWMKELMYKEINGFHLFRAKVNIILFIL